MVAPIKALSNLDIGAFFACFMHKRKKSTSNSLKFSGTYGENASFKELKSK